MFLYSAILLFLLFLCLLIIITLPHVFVNTGAQYSVSMDSSIGVPSIQ